MTTPWKPDGRWARETVAVLASGPSMSVALADTFREVRTIVVNDTHRAAPWADMLVALDGNWPQDYREFAGMRVSGFPDPELDALFVGWMWERVTRANGSIEFRNSGLAAIRIAAAMGASRILLAGFDPELGTHWFDDHHDRYEGVAEGLRQIRTELGAAGIVVEDVPPKATAGAPGSPTAADPGPAEADGAATPPGASWVDPDAGFLPARRRRRGGVIDG